MTRGRGGIAFWKLGTLAHTTKAIDHQILAWRGGRDYTSGGCNHDLDHAAEGGMMKLYHVQFDGQSFWIEAESFALAVVAWHWHCKQQDGDEYDPQLEPESVHLVHEEPVIRSEKTIAP